MKLRKSKCHHAAPSKGMRSLGHMFPVKFANAHISAAKKKSSPTPPPIHRTTPDAMQHRVAVGILGSDCKEVELGMPLIGVQWDSDMSHGHFRVQLSHCLPSRCSSGLCEDSSQPAVQTHQER